MNIISTVTVPMVTIGTIITLLICYFIVVILTAYLLKDSIKHKAWGLLTTSILFIFIIIGLGFYIGKDWYRDIPLTKTITVVSFDQDCPINELHEQYDHVTYDEVDNTFTLTKIND